MVIILSQYVKSLFFKIVIIILILATVMLIFSINRTDEENKNQDTIKKQKQYLVNLEFTNANI